MGLAWKASKGLTAPEGSNPSRSSMKNKTCKNCGKKITRKETFLGRKVHYWVHVGTRNDSCFLTAEPG